MSGYNLATYEEIPGSQIKARDQLKQQEASERFLSGPGHKFFYYVRIICFINL
jgi:hypothetical protein